MKILAALMAATAFWLPSSAQGQASDTSPLGHYRFITEKSTVEITGGFADIYDSLNIRGQFDLVAGSQPSATIPAPNAARHTLFVNVANAKGTLVTLPATIPPARGKDVNRALNLPGLTGQGATMERLCFTGKDGQGQPIVLNATIAGRLLHLVGTNAPTGSDLFNYKVDVYAHLLPWADFNADGRVDDADLTILCQNFGRTVEPGTDGDANCDGVVDAADDTAWHDQQGQSEAPVPDRRDDSQIEAPR